MLPERLKAVTIPLPTEKSVKIALRTQQIIAEETEVANVSDPLGGSWFVEAQTDRLEAEAERYFGEIEERGGVMEPFDYRSSAEDDSETVITGGHGQAANLAIQRVKDEYFADFTILRSDWFHQIRYEDPFKGTFKR